MPYTQSIFESWNMMTQWTILTLPPRLRIVVTSISRVFWYVPLCSLFLCLIYLPSWWYIYIFLLVIPLIKNKVVLLIEIAEDKGLQLICLSVGRRLLLECKLHSAWNIGCCLPSSLSPLSHSLPVTGLVHTQKCDVCPKVRCRWLWGPWPLLGSVFSWSAFFSNLHTYPVC